VAGAGALGEEHRLDVELGVAREEADAFQRQGVNFLGGLVRGQAEGVGGAQHALAVQFQVWRAAAEGAGAVEQLIGVVQARDIAVALFRGESLDLRRLARRATVVPDQLDAMDALEALRVSEVPVLFVHDEYGHFEGLVTPADLLSAIAGEFASDQDIGTDPQLVEREDGSLLISGSMPADALADRLGLNLDEDRDYATVAGHALFLLKHLPTVGESFVDQGWRFEIVDMDGRKIDKLLVSEAIED
jgi:putative hemolysin